MRKGTLLAIIIATIFMLPGLGATNFYNPSNGLLNDNMQPGSENWLAELPIAHSGTGAALDVSFTGSFTTNSSTWTQASSTYSELLTLGSSYSITNDSGVKWIAYVMVAPPPEVTDVGFSVDYQSTDWNPLSLTSPLGDVKTTPNDWYFNGSAITVEQSAVDSYGLWKLEFTGTNHITDLQLGLSGGTLSTTATFDVNDEMMFESSSSWITSASAEIVLTDPSGIDWYTATNTTTGSTYHQIQSFGYMKNLTVDNTRVFADLTDFPMYVDLLDTDLFGKVQDDGDDIVFILDGNIVPHEIDDFNPDAGSSRARLKAWIKVNLTDTVDTVVSMYYGNPVVGPQENPTEVWTNSYTAVWHLGESTTDEGTSAIHYDSTGNGYYGNQSGNNDVNSLFDRGQRFDGTNDHINITAERGMDPVGDVSISGWFRLDNSFSATSPTSQIIMGKYLSGDDDMHIALVGTDYGSGAPNGSLVWKVENNNVRMYKWTTTLSWAAGAWYHFVCTMDNSNALNNKIYIDGVDVTDTSYSGSSYAANLTFSGGWGIGGSIADGQFPGSPPQAYFDGTIDEVRITNAIRASNWILTEYSNQRFTSSFYSRESESSRTSPDLSFKKIVTSTADAGLWTATVRYNDTGSSVSYRVGAYQRNFIVQHDSTLTLEAPGDAVGDALSARIAGDVLYVEVSLADDITLGAISGSTVSMNWTVSGSPTTVYFEDLGSGRYGKSVNTSDLVDNKRWRLDIASSHQYYNDASTYFDLDLSHPTVLTYEWVSTTPVGLDFTATLVYTDAFDGSLISGATITFGDGSPVTVVSEANGRYNISISTGALSKGNHWYVFNASKPSAQVEMASVNITFTLRAHYTAVSVTGDLLAPYGMNTSLTVVLIDLDTGAQVAAADVGSLTFTSSYGSQVENTPVDYDITLTTNTWTLGSTGVTLSVVMSDPDYFAPSNYVFNVQIRAHYTSVSVTGILTQPYGNDTSLTVVLTDLDTGLLVDISDVASFTFTSSYGSQPVNPATSFDVTLTTNTWTVGVTIVTISVSMSDPNFATPTDYDFDVTIRSLTTYLYHEPTDLIFPSGDDFVIVLRVNVSESGNQYDGDPILGLTVGQFTVENSTYIFAKSIASLGNGRYQLTISGTLLTDDAYTIIVSLDPTNPNYASAILVISFSYRPAETLLSSPNYPLVITPYDIDVTIVLNYTDVDRSIGITGATLTPEGITFYGQQYTGGGEYEITLDVSGTARGTYEFNITASAPQYASKMLTFTLTIRVVFAYAIPTVGALDIPVGNDPVFYVEYWDIDQDIPIQGATVTSTWIRAPTVTYIPGEQRYRIDFPTLDTDTLQQNLVVTFNFSKGVNYQFGVFNITVTIRTHNTDFRLVSAVEPTGSNGIINISVYYGDLDNTVGITPIGSITHTVENSTGAIIAALVDDPQGDGFYILRIDANQFGLGTQTFNITFSWSGAGSLYETKWLIATANVVGEDSRLTLLVASEPSPYLYNMSYIFFYSDLAGVGISNASYGGGNVLVSVNFQGETVDLGQVQITEINQVGQPGNYSIQFNNSIFGRIGLVYMNVYINWSAGVAPYYTNRFDVISVRILARDTLVSVDPPSPTAYGENATFSFFFDDVTGGSNVPIADSSNLAITLSLADFTLTYNSGTKQFAVSFNTDQFGAPLGLKSFTIDVVWTGAPFYKNRTGKTVSVTVNDRSTVIDYLSPEPTPFSDSVTFVVDWIDVTDVPNIGVGGATLTLYDGAAPIPGGFYTVTPGAPGTYSIDFDTTYYSTPGTYDLTVRLTSPLFYYLDKEVTRPLTIMFRLVFLTAEPGGTVGYGTEITSALTFQDIVTSSRIANNTGFETYFEVLNATGTWDFSIAWNGATQEYDLTIQTAGETLAVGNTYKLWINMSYRYVSPYYSWDDTFLTFTIRERNSNLELQVAPQFTAYGENAVFTLYYIDIDTDQGIAGTTILLAGYTENVDFSVSEGSAGFYTITFDTSALGAPTSYLVEATADWSAAVSPYHSDAELNVSIRVTERPTIVDIVSPPIFTQYLDNISFSFRFTDTISSNAIAISKSDITILSEGVPLASGDFALIPEGSNFRVEINSTILSATLVVDNNITIIISWTAGSPYYSDSQTYMFVSTTNRVLFVVPGQIDSAAFGENLTLTFKVSDAGNSNPVSGVIVFFDSQNVSLTLGVDYEIVEGTGPDVGKYTITVLTSSLGSPGTFLFNLNVTWNPFTSPYYSNATTVVLTGVVLEISTLLTPQNDLVTVSWKDGATIVVEFYNFLYSNLTTGATVNWTWPGVAGDLCIDFGSTGIYTGSVDTSLADAGTHTITITARLDGYATAQTYITIVVQSLPSEIIAIDPSELVFDIDRGGAVFITIYLEDTSFGSAIQDAYVNRVYATLESLDYDFTFNGTPGYYETTIPSNGPTILDIGFYNVRLTANIRNYDPAAYLFKINLIQTKTALRLSGTTTAEMSGVFTQIIRLSVDMELPDFGNQPFENATLSWYIGAHFGNLTSFGNGTFFVFIDTTDIGYGIWPVSIRARTFANASEYADSSTQLTLTITRIETTVERLDAELTFYWGWRGNISLNFTGTFGHIPGAIGAYTLAVFSGNASDLNNGTYLVSLDTSVLNPGSYLLSITFSKPNYQEGPSSIRIIVDEVPTSIEVEYPELNYVGEGSDNTYFLQVPIGDSIQLDFFYNDSDNSEGFVGGLAGATNYTELTGPTLTKTSVLLFDLGDGYYRFVFDSSNPLFNPDLLTSESAYKLYVELKLENRSLVYATIEITIIEIPTSVEVIDGTFELRYGEEGFVTVQILDLWPGHGGAGIENANFSVSSSNPEYLTILDEQIAEISPGVYRIPFVVQGPFTSESGFSRITIELSIENYEAQSIEQLVEVDRDDSGTLLFYGVTYGVPLIGVFLLLVGLYIRVLSVPKMLRKLNGQIKALRKGKKPKPIDDVKSRQELVADLFNDTFSELAITRTAMQMPEETVGVEVPEMGELLIQLSILTNLSPDELDEFNADISKMKMSEQAAFVKEVIHQEAIRAARREGKTVEQIIAETEAAAQRRLGAEDIIEEAPEPVEPSVILPDEDISPEVAEDVTEVDEDIPEPADVVDEAVIDRLSSFELEDLKQDLVRKGVPEYEIDTIIKQVRNLPRDLVDELVRSLTEKGE